MIAISSQASFVTCGCACIVHNRPARQIARTLLRLQLPILQLAVVRCADRTLRVLPWLLSSGVGCQCLAAKGGDACDTMTAEPREADTGR